MPILLESESLPGETLKRETMSHWTSENPIPTTAHAGIKISIAISGESVTPIAKNQMPDLSLKLPNFTAEISWSWRIRDSIDDEVVHRRHDREFSLADEAPSFERFNLQRHKERDEEILQKKPI